MDEITLDMPGSPGADLLQKAPLFKTLGFEETLELAAITHVVKRKEGDKILEQDSLGSALFIIREGKAAVRSRDRITGEEKDLAVLGVGKLFGEMSLIEDQLVSADIIALTPIELLVLPRRDFENLLAKNVPLAAKVWRTFCRELSEKLRDANQKRLAAEALPKGKS